MIPRPKREDWQIGVIGTGGITESHLKAYATESWHVAALWNRTRTTAEDKRDRLAPGARVEGDWHQILADPAIDIVDITLHPEHRTPIVEAALKAGKHVLSQKPFVTDLGQGEALANLADEKGVKLAVNQNGRWAPNFQYIREAVRAGRIGTLNSAHARVHWDHSWTAGTPFDDLEDLILYDFGVHWFDFIASLAGDRIKAVTATATHGAGQKNKTAMLAQALIRLDGGQASLVFDGLAQHGFVDDTTVTGTDGTLRATGPDLNTQTVTLTNAEGTVAPELKGQWFDDGFRGTMNELMCAIEEDRPPENNARDNLQSLALTFAAVASRHERREVDVGEIRKLPG
ncbi:MAG: Gfo/Idh/MocA family oxidoreductase [Pseudomonadota bacterium]